MPRGRYLHRDDETGSVVAVEDFQCAAGPTGWRYVVTVRLAADGPDVGRVDLTLDGGGRQARVQLAGAGWLLRGGVAGRETVWLRTPDGVAAPEDAVVEQSEPAAGFTGRSPAFMVAAARLLRLTPGGRARIRLVAVSDPALGTTVLEQGWHLVGVVEHPTPTSPLPVARYQVTDLAVGNVAEVHLAGDVVLAAPGLELADLNAPPTLP